MLIGISFLVLACIHWRLERISRGQKQNTKSLFGVGKIVQNASCVAGIRMQVRFQILFPMSMTLSGVEPLT